MARPKLEKAAASFKALGHPTRLEILTQLRDHGGSLSPSELQALVTPSIALGSIAHHTRELKASGMITPAGTEPVRGALQHFYRLSPRGRALLEVAEKIPV